tara:strand:+ start:150 stop:1016 length:867 start_codon:yes stop_codon:yes gene_type:complete
MKDLHESLTVTIVLYNEKFEVLSKCLDQIKRCKIIIIDNGKDIDLQKKIQSKYEIFKYVLNDKNLGFSKGINQAIRLCDTEFILNLEADCIISKENISKLLEIFEKYENCMISTPTMIDENNNLTHSGGVLVEKGLGYKVLNLNGDVCVDFPMTAAILFKKKDMIEIGLFDEDLFIYYPDIEIGRRIKSFKRSVIQSYNSRAIHDMGTLKINNPIKRVYYRNYYFTLDGLIYYYKAGLHKKPIIELKQEIGKMIKKLIFKIYKIKFVDILVCISKISAYYTFKKKYLK